MTGWDGFSLISPAGTCTPVWARSCTAAWARCCTPAWAQSGAHFYIPGNMAQLTICCKL